MLPILISIMPLDLDTGQRVEILVGSAADATALGLGGKAWEPIISRRPRIAQDLMSLDLDGKFKLVAADFVLSLNMMKQHAKPDRLYWAGAAVVIYSVAQLDWDRRVTEFKGLVTTPPMDRDTRRVTLNCSVDRTRIDKPLLTGEFNGDNQSGGGPEMHGVPYPAGFGYVENVEWVLFDSIYNIGMLDGYGNLQSVSAAMEELADLGPSVGNYASYNQLRAAIDTKAIKEGQWGTCLASGMVGLGAPPAGRITFNATFGSNRTGAIIQRILKVHAGVADADVDLASLVNLDVVFNFEVRAHFKEQIQVSDFIEALCWPLNATPLVTVQNQIAVTRSVASAAVATIDASASVPPAVTGWRTGDPIVPLYTVIYRAERPADVLGYDEVNYVDDLIDRGLFDPAETYRQGNLVWLADKSRWLYINDTPAAGHVPGAKDANGNVVTTYWQQILAPTDATTIYYPSGSTLAEKEPAEPGADVTGNNTSKDTAAVAGRTAQEIVDSLDINTVALLQAILNGDELNQALQAMASVNGQPVSVAFLDFKGQTLGVTDALAYKFSLLGVQAPNGTSFILDANKVLVNANQSLAQFMQTVSAAQGDTSATVQLLYEAFVTNGTGYANAILRADADGVFGAFSITADGGPQRLSTIKMVADELYFIDRNNGGDPIRALYYADGSWNLADNLQVKNLAADTVTAGNIVSAAVQSIKYVITGADVSIARGATATVASITFTKDEATSLMKLQFFGMFWSNDDLQFTGSFVVDGGTAYNAGTVNVVLDSTNSLGKMPMTPFLYLPNLSKGQHTITFSVLNSEVDNIPLVVKAGSALEVIELKKASV